jgi:hypothetical protein
MSDGIFAEMGSDNRDQRRPGLCDDIPGGFDAGMGASDG